MNFFKLKVNQFLLSDKRISKASRIRFYIYFIIITMWIFASYTMPVFASLGGFEIAELYVEITENTREVNRLLNKAFQFSQVSPYDVVNSIVGTSSANIAIAVRNATKTVALIVATILLMVEFFRKSVNFEWSSKWENILIFLIKIIVVKQVVQNADVIVGYLYSGFQYINSKATNSNLDFLPCGEMLYYSMSKPYRGDNLFEWGVSLFWHEDITYVYEISQEAVHMIYPGATFPDATIGYELGKCPFEVPVYKGNFVPLLEFIFLQPQFLITKAIAIIVFVITIGRVFELSVYTIFAPLPLVTFASDTTHDIAKSFIKNYIATVIQIAVIVVMFIVYVSVSNYFVNNGYSNTKLIHLIALISLGLGVIKSGTWSKKICGAG